MKFIRLLLIIAGTALLTSAQRHGNQCHASSDCDQSTGHRACMSGFCVVVKEVEPVLKEFVIIIRKAVRANDRVGRFGGDEFLVILPSADKELTIKIAEQMRILMKEHSFRIKDTVINLTTSIGASVYPEDSLNAADMFNKSDTAMYRVKAKGGDGVEA